jgi:hypothetical protein
MSTRAVTVDPDQWLPPARQSFPLHELAEIFLCSVQHLSNLIEEGELIVPEESIDQTKSRSTIQIPRASVLDFLRRRSSPKFVRRARTKLGQKKADKTGPGRTSKRKK